MKRINKYQLSIIKIGLLVVFLIVVNCSLIIPTFAQESSQSASPSADLMQKINQIKQEVASRAATLKQEVNQKMQNKVYAGTLIQKSDTTLSVQGANDKLEILINEYTVFEDQTPRKDKKLSKDNLVENQSYIIALGDVDDKETLIAKKIIRATAPKLTKKIMWGQVQSVTDSDVIIKTKDNKKVTVETSDETAFDLNNQDASIKDVKQNKYLVAVGSGTDRLDAEYVHLIATTGYFKPQASPTPTPSPTPSPTPTATPKGKR